ncbi:MAG: GntR family transcriptional regulator / MocR family aminotransferase [Rhodobacteraceae bacterium]|uniref:MocR-like pyridoxine biosynthesis transcription factor PdxR n=1 Tax=Cypionkella sp. TaxID=2811411 RepID=UPI00132413FA|nr:PLP-dependent aminotransferase family protein [Cypionkella sp.]KAF0173398.1 MAG: GntR family transcriptional regulator / MocR family aminotransferase [Paracoccaceae bacterium]MDO8325843.1 PLP-dependent aminotransferase family protein [Cypionkella sp.]
MSIPAEAFVLPPAGRGTLQQRIRQMVTEGVLSGRFRAGQKMPSSRGLAEHLGISRITVTLAYAELVSADYLMARGRSGYFISENAPRAPELPARAPRAEGVDFARLTGERFSGLATVKRPLDWENYPYPFIYGQADASLFDHQNWRLCALRALGRKDFAALTSDMYDRDDPLLIEHLLRSILPRRGIAAREDEVLLTLGAQNALWITVATLLGPGRRAVVENPGYSGLRGILEPSGAEVISVDVDADGLPPDAVPRGVDVVFTTASHQCPTNATMPLERRIALLEAASREGFVIVEDDYEFEMSFLKPVSPALKSLDSEGRVIYAGSFSKSVFPGMRLGYLVGPASFIREARALRLMMLRHPPGHIQRTVAYFLSLGHYDALINRMRNAYRRRRQVMEEAIRDNGLVVAGQGGFGGSSFWMRAPAGVDTEKLAEALRAEGVLIEPGRAFFDPAQAPRNFYRLGYSSISPAKIPEGIARIGRAIRAA